MMSENKQILEQFNHLIKILTSQEEVLSKIEDKIDSHNQELTKAIHGMTSAVQSIAQAFDTHVGELVAALTGRDHFPAHIAIMVIKMLGVGIISLVFALIVALTGVNFNLLPQLWHP